MDSLLKVFLNKDGPNNTFKKEQLESNRFPEEQTGAILNAEPNVNKTSQQCYLIISSDESDNETIPTSQAMPNSEKITENSLEYTLNDYENSKDNKSICSSNRVIKTHSLNITFVLIGNLCTFSKSAVEIDDDDMLFKVASLNKRLFRGEMVIHLSTADIESIKVYKFYDDLCLIFFGISKSFSNLANSKICEGSFSTLSRETYYEHSVILLVAPSSPDFSIFNKMLFNESKNNIKETPIVYLQKEELLIIFEIFRTSMSKSIYKKCNLVEKYSYILGLPSSFKKKLLAKENEIIDSVTSDDIKCLAADCFLNDSIIDFYLKHLMSYYNSSETFHILSSFFYTSLKHNHSHSLNINDDYSDMDNWIKDVNIFAKKNLLIPVIEEHHWFLIVVCNINSLLLQSYESMDESKRCFILILDSLNIASKFSSYRLIEKFLQYHMEKKLKFIKPIISLKAEVPKQNNSVDCGLFLLEYAENFIKDIDIDWWKNYKSMSEWFPAISTSRKRSRILCLINQL